MKERSSAETGIMGCANDKWKTPPRRCACLFAEGIWLNCTSCRCGSPRVCLCISLRHVGRLGFVFFSATVFLLLPAHMCWCASPHVSVWQLYSVCVHSLCFPHLRGGGICIDLECISPSSPSLLWKGNFKKLEMKMKKKEMNKVKKRNNICLKNRGNIRSTGMQNRSLFVVFPSTSKRLRERTTHSC